MDGGSTAPAPSSRARPRADGPGSARYPPDAGHCAAELLSIVAYLTSRDGPLQAGPGPSPEISPWHEPLLRKAAERLDVVDAYMRARVAFLVSGKERGYYAPQADLDLAGATLDAARAATAVVTGLLEGRLPTPREFDAMAVTSLGVPPALEAVRESEAPSGS